MTVISESGFYDVVVRSDKPQGKALRALLSTPGANLFMNRLAGLWPGVPC